MPEYLAPGVYVEETSFRAKSIEGVGTSTTAFVGPTRRGPVTGTPELVTSLPRLRTHLRQPGKTWRWTMWTTRTAAQLRRACSACVLRQRRLAAVHRAHRQ